MKTILLTAGILWAGTVGRAATLAADYQFQNTFASSANPITTPLIQPSTASGNTDAFVTDTVDGQSRTVYSFSNNFGLGLNTFGLISNANYSIVIDAKLNPISDGTASPAAKLIDFNNLLADTGLYNLANALDFYNVPTAVGTNVPALASTADYVEIALTRDATDPANPLVSAYINGVSAFVPFVDSSGLAVIAAPADPTTQVLHFFMNDSVGIVSDSIDPETQSGDVSRIRVYDGALTANQVAALTPLPAPEPATAGVVGIGALLCLRRRRR